MSQRRDLPSGVALWGNMLCHQLSLPSVNWEGQRDKYPFFRDFITPALFVQPNPCAFQSLIHYLFSLLDPIDASEKFFGLWPLKSGDRKAESQFRTVIFRWLGQLQKGEWSSAPNPKRAISARHEAEAVAEAKRLGPILFDMRLTPSHYVTPVGEDPTALLAKFAHLVESVETIRQYGAIAVGFPPTVAERQRGKRNTRGSLKSAIAARRADMACDQYEEVLERASEEAIQLNLACQTASKLYENVKNLNAEVMERVVAASTGVEINQELPPDIATLGHQVGALRSFEREVIAQVDVLEMVTKQKHVIDMSLQAVYSLNDQPLTFPELTAMALKLKDGKSTNLEEVLSVSNRVWDACRSYIEKQSIDKARLVELQTISQESLKRINVVDPKMKEYTEKGQSYSREMKEFIRNQQRPVPEPPRAPIESDLMPFSSVPSVEDIAAKLTARFGLSQRQRHIEALISAKGNDVNNNISDESMTEDDAIVLEENYATLDNAKEKSSVNKDTRPSSGTPTSPLHETVSNDPIEVEDDAIGSKFQESAGTSGEARLELPLESFKLLSVSGGESVFSPLVRQPSKPSVFLERISPDTPLENTMFGESGDRDESAEASFRDASPSVAPDESRSSSVVPPSILSSGGSISVSDSPRVGSFHSVISLDFSDGNESSTASASIPHVTHRGLVDVSMETSAANVADRLDVGDRPERRWSSLGAKEEETLANLGSSFLDDSDAFA